jgi:hypothetical protein
MHRSIEETLFQRRPYRFSDSRRQSEEPRESIRDRDRARANRTRREQLKLADEVLIEHAHLAVEDQRWSLQPGDGAGQFVGSEDTDDEYPTRVNGRSESSDDPGRFPRHRNAHDS